MKDHKKPTVAPRVLARACGIEPVGPGDAILPLATNLDTRLKVIVGESLESEEAPGWYAVSLDWGWGGMCAMVPGSSLPCCETGAVYHLGRVP
jgi:hypothetical protein